MEYAAQRRKMSERTDNMVGKMDHLRLLNSQINNVSISAVNVPAIATIPMYLEAK